MRNPPRFRGNHTEPLAVAALDPGVECSVDDFSGFESCCADSHGESRLGTRYSFDQRINSRHGAPATDQPYIHAQCHHRGSRDDRSFGGGEPET